MERCPHGFIVHISKPKAFEEITKLGGFSLKKINFNLKWMTHSGIAEIYTNYMCIYFVEDATMKFHIIISEHLTQIMGLIFCWLVQNIDC